jgi:hypothetical protein
MSKALLEYNLDEHSENIAFERAVKSTDMALALWEIQINGRRKFIRKLEYDIESKQSDGYESAVNDIFDWINEELFNRGIIIDNLIE